LVTFTGESDVLRKSLALYIDCTLRKTYVTEIGVTNKLISDVEQKREMKLEVDIDTVEQLFDNQFFDKHLI
jgi:hypothetical protein